MDQDVAAGLSSALAETVAVSTARGHRDDPVRGRAGGPAGNARLTSWTGIALLVLLAVEGATLLSIGRLLGVHIWVGAALTPVVLLKTASTGWRVLRYYSGDADYVHAGPPPLLLRVLGPLVVLSTLAVLASGLALLAVHPDSPGSAGALVLTLHKASFVAWFGLMTLHVLARTVPALREVASRQGRARRVPGGVGRLTALALTATSGVVLGTVLLGAASWWTGSWGR